MSSVSQGGRSQTKLPRVAIASGLIAAFITAGAVSWSTPDGNLVIPLVPALAVGLAVFGLVLWRSHRRGWRGLVGATAGILYGPVSRPAWPLADGLVCRPPATQLLSKTKLGRGLCGTRLLAKARSQHQSSEEV